MSDRREPTKSGTRRKKIKYRSVNGRRLPERVDIIPYEKRRATSFGEDGTANYCPEGYDLVPYGYDSKSGGTTGGYCKLKVERKRPKSRSSTSFKRESKGGVTEYVGYGAYHRKIRIRHKRGEKPYHWSVSSGKFSIGGNSDSLEEAKKRATEVSRENTNPYRSR